MMRSVWIALSTLALANLMAIAVLVLWLNGSGRLNAERVETVRRMFAVTVAQERQAKAAEKAAADQVAKDQAEEARQKRPPITAEQRLEIIREYEETQRQKTDRLRRETADLLNQLDLRRADFENERAAFIRERDAYQKVQGELAAAQSNEQFSKALRLYESVKAPEAAAMMQTLLSAGKKSEVVAYLNQMQARTAARVISEFQKQDPALAAGLLESLRTLGRASPEPGTATPRAADAQQPRQPVTDPPDPGAPASGARP